MPSLRVLFIAAEADPFIKIGGLGDVAGSLPPALRALALEPGEVGGFTSIDVRLVIPYYGIIQSQDYFVQRVATFNVASADGPIQTEAFMTMINDLPVYFLSGSPIKADAPVYTADASVDGIKFTFFSLAALELARALNWPPNIVHANDWHTSLAIYSLGISRKRDAFYYNTATLLGLHNLPYLGGGTENTFQAFNLPPATNSRLPKWAQSMPLPLGLLSADHIVAVSPTYAKEILTPEFGSGLQDFLHTRSDTISGILNGLDIQRWNPETDSALVSNFSAQHLEERKANKVALQKELDLPADPDIPIFGMVSRMDNQKGFDLIPGALRQIANMSWQAVILGTGDPKLEAAVRRLQEDYPGRVRGIIRYDNALSRRIYAGADSLLIPSRYEPCGLTQMIAMRYGCVPIARATGGLKDTIQDFHQSPQSTGFLFNKASSASLSAAMRRALLIYPDQNTWHGMQMCGMAQDFSWERFAQQYFELYKSLVSERNRVAPSI
jgi:starch synthase